jgi:lipopolysaccharide/colanic/teichoic acid biosynthesis glycosyltransferase
VALSLPLLLPVLVLIGCWVKLVSRGPVFYRQQRVGRRGKQFTIYKFRTMYVNADARAHHAHAEQFIKSDRPMTKLDMLGDSRVIRGGLFLRMSGFDELPQLLNVLRGEMSVVGPRPCVPEEFALYGADQLDRFAVMPGLTGYWQVNGKNRTTFREMIHLDEHYVRHYSLGLDLLILGKTPVAVMAQLYDCLMTRINERRRERLQHAADSPSQRMTMDEVGISENVMEN